MTSVSYTPFRLGVTGGIGSGKTSVCKVFNVLGIPVFSADTVAREIMDRDEGIKQYLNTIAGKDLYRSGELNRTELADMIFNNRALLEKVNSLVHPAVFEKFSNWSVEQSSPYVIIDAAILLESGASKLVNRIATVVAPVEERIERVMQRNKLAREQVLERIRNQMEDSERIKFSHYIISNSENDMIIPAIIRIHDDLLNTTKS